MEFRSFTQAIKFYRLAKKLSEKNHDYKDKLLMYQQLGYVYRLTTEHEEALK